MLVGEVEMLQGSGAVSCGCGIDVGSVCILVGVLWGQGRVKQVRFPGCG